MANKLILNFCTLFNLGFVKFMPGTIGSLVSLPIGYLILKLCGLLVFILVIIALLTISYFAVSKYLTEKKSKDPKEVIIDEFIGQSIPIYLYEISHGTQKTSDEAIIFYGICFVLFRFFDILKPFPVSYFDKNYKNSFGVIMDDVCAGLYVVLSLICFMLLSSYLI